MSGDAGAAVGRRDVTWRPWLVVGSVLALLLLLAFIDPAAATPPESDTPRVSVELNRLEDVAGGCRLSLVFTNGLPVAIDALSIETVLFDAGGRVERFLLLKARPLAAGRTRVQQFDVKEAACGSIGRLLLNDVTQCDGEGLDPAGCLAAIAASSRSDVDFVSVVASD